MKNIAGIIATTTAIAALFASSTVLATGSHTGGGGTVSPGAASVGNVSVGTAVAGTFSVGNNGTATSYAQNKESAKAMITATKSLDYCYGNTNAAIQGATKTESAGVAYNTSTGSGSGYAQSAGYADTATRGTIGVQGVTSGFNGGESGTHTNNLIKAGINQGSYVSGETVSGFDARVSYNKGYSTLGGNRAATIEMSGANSGYASGANASGALENMNAAGIANIGASGYFFGKTNLSGSTGNMTTP